MYCPQCRVEYREGFVECADCHVPLTPFLQPEAADEDYAGASDLDALIRTSCRGPIAVGLAQSLLEEARIPYFVVDQSIVVRQDSGNIFGCLDVRVPRAREAEACEILRSVEEMK